MFTKLRCSWRASACKASLKEGDTRRFRVSDLISSVRKGAPQMPVQMHDYSVASWQGGLTRATMQ